MTGELARGLLERGRRRRGRLAVSAAAVGTALVLGGALPGSAAPREEGATARQVTGSGWIDGDADWQHDSYNRNETTLGAADLGPLQARLTIAAAGSGSLTMPTIDGSNRLFLGRWSGQERRTLEARDGTTGRVLWRQTAPADFEPFVRQPKYLAGRVYATTSGGVTPSSVYDSTDALDAATGRRLWTVKGYADLVGSGQLVVRNSSCDSGGCSRFWLTAYDAATGRLSWQRTIVPKEQYGGGYSGAVLNAGVLYAGEDDAGGHPRLLALDARTGAVRWTVDTRTIPQPAAVDAASGVVLVAESDGVHALDPGSGRTLWRRTGLTVLNGSSYWLPGGAAGGAVAVGAGAVYALCGRAPGSALCTTRLADGAALRSYPAPRCGSATRDSWTGLALANGVLYAATTQCGLVAIDTSAQRVLRTVVPGQQLLRPEVANGRLYVGTSQLVTALAP